MGIRVKDLTEIDVNEIEKLYLTGEYSLTKLGQQFSCHRKGIAKVIKDKGITTQPRSKVQRKYSVVDTCFSSIETEYAAYYLGLLYADGYNDASYRHTVCLSLQKRDTELLLKYKEFTGTTAPLRYDIRPNRNEQVLCCITNKQISEDLKRWGCVSPKSLTLTFPTFLSEELVPHFIRGYFDGDGSVGEQTISIVSTENFCKSVKNILKEMDVNCGIRPINGRSVGNETTSELVISGGRQTRTFLKWIYKDATIYLERKHRRFQRHLEYEKYLLSEEYRTIDGKKKAKELLHAIIKDHA